MTAYHWICLTAFSICMFSCLYHFLRVAAGGLPVDYAAARGKVAPAVFYSFTRGMSPKKKETAYLHLPTYTAGIIFHIGTFFSFLCLLFIFFGIGLDPAVHQISAVFLTISGFTGLGILVKRSINKVMRSLSNPDDYISNLLVSMFHLLTAVALVLPATTPVLLSYASILFLYFPLGKLRHAVYFFTSRFHLGVYYGRRGTWPIKKQNIWEEN